MSEIKVEINAKEQQQVLKTEIQSNTLSDLLTSLTKAKMDTNSALTKIVDARKQDSNTKSQENNEEEEEDEED